MYFNLAAEDYFLYHTDEDVLMLWRSKKAVVCGKHQNVCAEVNYGFCKGENIQVARRLSGGGTVYHDLGNVNFSFICSAGTELEKAIDFKRFLQPIKTFLNEHGIAAEFSDRNDLFIGDNKISGNAEHLFQKEKRVIHHGTLLFSADLSRLGKALKPDGTYMDKAVKSVRMPVTNIENHGGNFSRPENFIKALTDFFVRKEKYALQDITPEENAKIHVICKEKYAQSEWILGYSPKYTMQREFMLAAGKFVLEMEVEKRMINSIAIRDVAGKLHFEKELDKIKGKTLSEKTEQEFFDLTYIPGIPYLLF